MVRKKQNEVIDESAVIPEIVYNVYARVTAKQRKEMDEDKKSLNMVNDSELIRHALSNLHQDTVGMKRVSSRANTSPFPVGRPKGLSKEEKKLERYREIAKALDGEIVMRGESETVVYTIYEKTNPVLVQKFEQELPLTLMDEKLVRNQYKPNREECEETLKLMAKKK